MVQLTIEQALQRGIEAQKAGLAQKANRIYTKILEVRPKHPNANHNKGALMVSIGRIHEALPFFKTAIEVDPDQDQFWLSYVDTLIKLNKISEAKSLLVQAKNQRSSAQVFNKLEQKLIGFSPRNNSTSIKNFKNKDNKVKKKNPSQLQLQTLISVYNQGHFQQALEKAGSMSEQFPRSITLHNICGACHLQMQNFDAAIKRFKQVLKIDSSFTEAHNNLGNALRNTNNLDASLACYKKALKLKPNFAEAHNNMAIVLKDKGDLEGAIKSCHRCLELKPDFAEAYLNIGSILQTKGDLKEALENFKHALTINPEFAEAYRNIGPILEDQGDIRAALVTYEEALKIKPDYAEARYLMGELLLKSSQFEQAQSCFDKLKDMESIGMGLECAYRLENYTDFNKRLNLIACKNPNNIRVAAISAFAAHQMQQKDIYPFCKNSIDIIRFSNIKNHAVDSDQFIATLLDEMTSLNMEWEPKNRTTRGGFRTNDDLFKNPSPSLQLLKRIIQEELELYYLQFSNNKDAIFQNWPEKKIIKGWYNRLLKSGHQISHIHPSGWMSGVFYLKTIEAPSNSEGAIEFSLHGNGYQVKNYDYPRRIYQPSKGDLILFPSCLFHNTIPVIKDAERCVIAFDLQNETFQT